MAAMDGLEFVGCQMAGTAWQQFLSIESQKKIVAHDIVYVIQWLCISTLTMIIMNSLSVVWTSLLVVEGHKVKVVNS